MYIFVSFIRTLFITVISFEVSKGKGERKKIKELTIPLKKNRKLNKRKAAVIFKTYDTSSLIQSSFLFLVFNN